LPIGDLPHPLARFTLPGKREELIDRANPITCLRLGRSCVTRRSDRAPVPALLCAPHRRATFWFDPPS